MKIPLIFFTILLLITSSCLNKHSEYPITETAQLFLFSEEEVMATDLFKEMKVVALKTTNNVLLSEIADFEIHNGFIVVLDLLRSSLFFFNMDGVLKRTLNSQGKGPGEYIGITDFLVDKNRNTIEILDNNSRKIHIFDFESLDYQESVSLSLHMAASFAKDNGHYYFQTNGSVNQIDDKPTKSEIISFDYKNNKYYALFGSEVVGINEPHYFYEFNKIFYTNPSGKVFASMVWHEAVYSLNGNSLDTFLIIDSGKRAYPKEILEANFHNKVEFINSPSVLGKINFFKLLFQNEDSYMFCCKSGSVNSDKLHFFSFDEGEREVFSSKIKNNFVPFKNQRIDIFKEAGGWIISALYPYRIDDAGLLQGLGVDQNSNPILLFFTPR